MSDTNANNNPHFNHFDRASYELGYLLQKLPSDFSSYSTATPETLLIADAARRHAENANSTIMNGLEAIGEMMFFAGANKENEIEPNTIASLGCLIRQLAVEAQFLQETGGDLEHAVNKHNEQLSAAKKESHMPSGTHTPEQSSEIISRLTEKANAVAALLSALDFLPSDDCRNAMETCSALASDVASDLAALVGGAA